MNKDQEKFWHDLTKEYLTTEQKLEFIREYNALKFEEEFAERLEQLQEYIKQNKQ